MEKSIDSVMREMGRQREDVELNKNFGRVARSIASTAAGSSSPLRFTTAANERKCGISRFPRKRAGFSFGTLLVCDRVVFFVPLASRSIKRREKKKKKHRRLVRLSAAKALLQGKPCMVSLRFKEDLTMWQRIAKAKALTKNPRDETAECHRIE